MQVDVLEQSIGTRPQAGAPPGQRRRCAAEHEADRRQKQRPRTPSGDNAPVLRSGLLPLMTFSGVWFVEVARVFFAGQGK